MTSKGAGAADVQAATETGVHRTIASLPLTSMATGRSGSSYNHPLKDAN